MAAVIGAGAASCRDSVSAPAVASVVVVPDSTTIIVGASTQFAATARDARGDPLAGRTIAWSTPDGSIVSVSPAGLVTALSPGRATVTASSGGRTGTAIVLAAPPRDFSIVNAQFTQAVQASDGSIAMVLGGSGAAVNVLVSSNAATAVSMRLVLRLTDAAGNVRRADTVSVSVAPGSTPAFDAPTAQFLLPPSVLEPGIRWQVVRDPMHVVPDNVSSNDVFPQAGPALLATVAVPPLKLRFVPIVLTSHGNATGNVNAGNIPQYLRTLESVHPLAGIDASVGPPLSTGASFGTPPRGGDALSFWTPVLLELDLARIADADPAVHWVGVVLPPAGFNFTINGGAAYIPLSGLSSGPGTRTSAVTSLGWANDPAFTREIVAHELGHNFGRRHAPCGNPSSVDPLYPHAGGVIGQPGHDVRGWMTGLASVALTMPATTADVMGYCSPVWASEYTYKGVLAFRGTVAAARSAVASAISDRPARVLVVRGTVVDGRDITLAPAFSLDARPNRPELRGSYHLEGRTRGGRVLFADDFAPATIDHAPAIGHFTFAIPVTAEVEDSLATIEVRGPAGSARLSRPVAPALLRSAAALTPQRTPGGMTAIVCADANALGILVRDAVSGALLGSANGDAMRVSAASGTPLTIVCSDGIRSSSHRVIAP